MSLLLRGMKMPTSCPCELVGVGYDMYCSFAFGIPSRVKQYDECCENGTRPDWCPLIELPEKHRRLIEEPKGFNYGGLAYISPYDFEGTAKYFFEQVKAQPTILESEGME